MNENRVFELRVYTANEGKLEALKARFRDHTTALFNKHHMEVIGHWPPQEPDKAKDMFIYILAHPSRADAEENWNAFKVDPDWISVKAASERNGAVAQTHETKNVDDHRRQHGPRQRHVTVDQQKPPSDDLKREDHPQIVRDIKRAH